MSRKQAAQSLLALLAPTWPENWQKLSTAAQSYPLAGEVQALTDGTTSHLPFFRDDGEVVWITLAPDSDELRSSITGLRAWIIPSFAWEDRQRPVVPPRDYSGPLASALLHLAPAGYYRWHSSNPTARRLIPDKLRLWRQLQAQRPTFVSARLPTLFELREQFRLALATGDRLLADQAVNAIDDRKLDTAANTLFMRTQTRARFGCYREITNEPLLQELLGIRHLPQLTRTAIVEAFFEVYLRQFEESGSSSAATQSYAKQVHPAVGALLAVSRPEDSEAVAVCLRYYASHVSTITRPTLSLDLTFFEAMMRGDWREMHETGTKLLSGGEVSESVGAVVSAALVESFNFQANSELASLLKLRGATVAPQNWLEFISCLRRGDGEQAREFLLAEQRPVLDPGDPAGVLEILVAVEELLTNPFSSTDGGSLELLIQGLAALIEDLVGESAYPRPELARVYLSLLQLWTQHRSARVRPADSNAAICLAAGTLACLAEAESETTELLRQWWNVRPVRARLPFLLEALDLLVEYSSEFGIAQGMWVDGVEFIRRNSVELTRTERELWRSIGSRLGFDVDTLEEYVPAIKEEDDDETDPIANAGLTKVAIVSLHEKPAQAAAVLIAQRTNAQVVVVSELVAGPATQSARTADVILLVWAATKHAVYQVFDDMRDKVAYVQGTGASSIFLALERWVRKRLTTT